MITQRYLNGFELKKEAYSTREVAELFGVTLPTVHNWIKAGRLNGAMMAPKAKKAKTDRGRYMVYSDGLHDLELNREQLISASMKYWPSLLRKLHKQ